MGNSQFLYAPETPLIGTGSSRPSTRLLDQYIPTGTNIQLMDYPSVG
jgi:hypothetical protein